MKKKRSARGARKGARLGQHFLRGLWAAKKLAGSIAQKSGETILEIGPGHGALTRELLATGAPVVAIEKDAQLVAELHETFAEEIRTGDLTLIEDDVRNFDAAASNLGRYVVAANIPYYITGEIIRIFLTSPHQPSRMALLVQKEVAARIVARDGKESVLSLSVKAYGSPRIVATVSRGNFFPQPSVDSAILLIDAISRDFFSDIDEGTFFATVHAGFSSKRKSLAGNLKKKFDRVFDIDKNVRAEDVALEEWKGIVRSL